MDSRMVDSLGRELFTYTLMLKQVGAPYDSAKLKGIVKALEQLCYHFSKLIQERPEYLHNIIKLCILNLQVDAINEGYKELVPVCEYIQKLLDRMLEEYQKTNKS